jgi:hypothetical protein
MGARWQERAALAIQYERCVHLLSSFTFNLLNSCCYVMTVLGCRSHARTRMASRDDFASASEVIKDSLFFAVIRRAEFSRCSPIASSSLLLNLETDFPNLVSGQQGSE